MAERTHVVCTLLVAAAVAALHARPAAGQQLSWQTPDLHFSVINASTIAPHSDRAIMRLTGAVEQRSMQEYGLSQIPDHAHIVDATFEAAVGTNDWHGLGGPQFHSFFLEAYFGDGQAGPADFGTPAAVIGTATIFYGESQHWFDVPVTDVVQSVVASGYDWIGFRARCTTTNNHAYFDWVVNFNLNYLPDPCQGDLTATAVAGQAGYGVPNGVVNNDDFFYFLSQFAAGNKQVCDLTYGATPGQFGYAIPNGQLTNDDFFYYLVLFARGCSV